MTLKFALYAHSAVAPTSESSWSAVHLTHKFSLNDATRLGALERFLILMSLGAPQIKVPQEDIVIQWWAQSSTQMVEFDGSLLDRLATPASAREIEDKLRPYTDVKRFTIVIHTKDDGATTSHSEGGFFDILMGRE